MAINKRIIRSNDEAAVGASFNTVLYTGNGGTQSITGVGFEPDFVWIKARTEAENHYLQDTVRGFDSDGTGGADSYIPLISNTTDAESNFPSTWHNNYGYLNSIDPDGFTVVFGVGSIYDSYNKSGVDYVAWCWKAGGAAVANPQGNTASLISANPDAGFSIITHTSGMLSSNTFGHGLNKEPDVIISKIRNLSDNWIVHTPNIGGRGAGTNVLKLNTTDAFENTLVYNGDSSTFNVQWTSATYDFVHYCFHSVAGFSKFGSYTGNGSTSGPTIDCGFEPAFVMVKSAETSLTNWNIHDNKRDTDSLNDKYLFANLSNAEIDNSAGRIIFLENGFQIGTSDISRNESGIKYIYMAFANQF